MMDNLKPCPFCGGNAKPPYKETNGDSEFWLPRARHAAWCPFTTKTWNEIDGYISPEAAAEAWNRRTSDAPTISLHSTIDRLQKRVLDLEDWLKLARKTVNAEYEAGKMGHGTYASIVCALDEPFYERNQR